jgi:hypothetical protein
MYLLRILSRVITEHSHVASCPVQQSSQDPDQSGFSSTVRPDQSCHRPGTNLGRNFVKRRPASGIESHGQIADLH